MYHDNNGTALSPSSARPEEIPSVMATVVTFSAPSDLRACVEALHRQTRPPDHVLVIDNAGQPPAAVSLANVPDVTIQRLTCNSGPAGGFAAGFNAFLSSAHDLIWVMDDDVIPDVDCLEILLAEARRSKEAGYFRPSVRDLGGGELPWPGWSGVLIPRRAVERVGVPNPDWVWFFEDTDYLQRRMAEAGLEVHDSPRASVTHRISRRTRTKPAWKIYYETRNAVVYRIHVQRGRRWYKLLRSLVKMAARILIREDEKWRKTRAYSRALLDGARGKLGMTFPMPSRAIGTSVGGSGTPEPGRGR